MFEFIKKLFSKSEDKNKTKIPEFTLQTYLNGMTIIDKEKNYVAVFSYDQYSGFYLCTQSIVKEFIQGHTYAALTITRFVQDGLNLNY